jgi:hypothetical protein
MSDGISTIQFLKELESAVKKLGGHMKAAEEWGVNPSQVGGAIRGERTPGPKILAAMGYESVKAIRYRYRKV